MVVRWYLNGSLGRFVSPNQEIGDRYNLLIYSHLRAFLLFSKRTIRFTPPRWILGIIAVAIPLFKYLWNHFAWFRGAIYGLWNVIKLVFGKIGAFIAPTVSGIANAVKASFGGLWRVCTRVLGWLWHIVSRVFGGIYNRVSHSVGSLWKYLKEALGLIAGLFQSVLGGVYDFFCGVFQGIYHTVMGVIQTIVGAVKKA